MYVKNGKISENILFVLEHTELVGIIQLLSSLLLSNGQYKPKTENSTNNNVLPQTILSASVIGIKVMNNIARIDLKLFQGVLTSSYHQEQFYHICYYIISYSLDNLENCEDTKELLHETLLLMNYFCLNKPEFQEIFSRGEVTLLQRICALPFNYFCDKKTKDILFPTLICICYLNDRNLEILNKEITLEMFIIFLKEMIKLEPIIEEEEIEKVEDSMMDNDDIMELIKPESKELNIVSNSVNMLDNIKDIKDSHIITSTTHTVDSSKEVKEVKNHNLKRTMSFSSSASSTKSCHDMVTGNSDFVLLYHRFPRNLWEKALDYIANYGK